MRHLYLVNENELAGECGPLRVPSTLKQVPEIAGCATYISLKPPRRRPRAAEVESQQSDDIWVCTRIQASLHSPCFGSV